MVLSEVGDDRLIMGSGR